jgi:hypothetical protein
VDIKFTNTKKSLTQVGFILKKGLQDELKAQKHNATGRLSRGIRHHIKDLTLSMMSPVSYWKAVNNPKFARVPNFQTIKKWVSRKGLPPSSVVPIFRKLQGFYGEPYVYWTEGNDLRRTNFAGYVAKKFSKKIAEKLAPSIGRDVASAIGQQLKTSGKGVTTGGWGFLSSL